MTFFKKSGFSLIELLLVITLFPVVSFALYSNFSSGVNLWKALKTELPYEDVHIFFEESSADFHNALRYADIHFAGNKEGLVFAASTTTPLELGGERGIGQLTYFYDSSQKAIVREKKNLSEFYKEKPGQKRQIVRGVSFFEISYFARDPKDRVFRWLEEWNSGEKNIFPVAVRFNFEVVAALETKYYTKTFPIPIGETK